MSTRRMLVCLIALALAFATATDGTSADPPTTAAALAAMENEGEHLRTELRTFEEKLERVVLNPTLEQCDAQIKAWLGKKELYIKEVGLEIDAGREVINMYLDHYTLARTRLDLNGGIALDLIGADLVETKLAKMHRKKLQDIKYALAKKEQEIAKIKEDMASAGLTGSEAQPGLVPELSGMRRRQASVILKNVHLIGKARYDGAKPTSDEELDRLQVVSQVPAAGTKLEPGKGVVVVTLSLKAPSDPGPDDLAWTGPRDGRYRLMTIEGTEVAQMEWSNKQDGSAEMKLFVTLGDFFGKDLRHLTDKVTFVAARDAATNTHIAAGKDFQDFVGKLFRSLDGNVTNVQSNLRFVVKTKGTDLVLKLEGNVRTTGVRDGKAFNENNDAKDHPGAEIIGKLILK